MTAAEELQHRHDGFMRLLSAVTDHYIKIIHALNEDMKREFAESRAESRAQSEALMRVLDRLPPAA